MGAKVLRESEIEQMRIAEARKPASAAVIMESMVATEAELAALRAETDYSGFGFRATRRPATF